MTKKITMVITVVFFATMLLLSLTAKKLYQSSLPKVQVATLEYENFEEEGTTDGGQFFDFAFGLPKDLYNGGTVYVISNETINGEIRTIARTVVGLKLGRENEDYYEVLEGISYGAQVIIRGGEIIQDGDEVLIEE